ncbi:MAG: Flp pilus assembly complex ATPase component TadA, partial [Deltaproteobacteria bacterium]|nr:Flp pilus assembly complex ATPase component TadA [Deltaproteobacteria bacterium]
MKLSPDRGKLGERLVEAGLIDKDQLRIVLEDQKKNGAPLGKVLQRSGYVSEEAISSVLADQAGVEKVEIDSYYIPGEVLDLIPYAIARKYKLIPLSLDDNQLTIAMANPFDIAAVQEIERLTDGYVDIKASTETEILKAIDSYYKEDNKGYSKEIEELLDKDRVKVGFGKDAFSMAPIVKLVNQTIAQAIAKDATDIHIEPKEKGINCRFRIDGILYESSPFPKNLQPAITVRIKIMANLNISENRLPQDGRIIFPFSNRKIDLRVSIMPSIYGEKIVLRVLDKERLVLGLEQLGFSPSALSVFKEAILKTHGIILVCGPTGSGKTTTLYSTLSYTNSREKNIVTLEDPVEYEIPEICQSQINLKAGLTFASGLRSILRQDPDVILVGEIRDAETVEIAMRAAITGHLVFSTLHTNDAVGAITRLLDMGVEPYLLASSLVFVIGQRLVRVICPFCKERDQPGDELLKAVKGLVDFKNMVFYRGKGCNRCSFTGYKGRIGIFEILPLSASLVS